MGPKSNKKRKNKKTRRGRRGRSCWKSEEISIQDTDAKEIGYNSNVLNLSDRILTDSETMLLSKGLNFHPNRHFNLFDTILDVNKFVRNLTIKKHFFSADEEDHCKEDTSIVDDSQSFSFRELCAVRDLEELANEGTSYSNEYNCESVLVPICYKSRSDFYPVNSRTPEMNRFQKMVERDLTILAQRVSGGFTPWYDNLSKQEREALKILEADKSIVIRNSDKGGLIVVMNQKSYLDETNRQLSDQSTYIRLRGDPTKTYKNILIELVNRGHRLGIFNEKEVGILVPAYPTLPTFYHLPKTHKGLSPLQGRPIIAGIGSLNEKLGQWLDGQLQPLVVQLPGYLKDTNHLLQIMQNFTWGKDYTWITCDVSSLYSSIPHNLAVEAVSFFLETFTDFHVEIHMYILDVLEYLLAHNYFVFDGVFYLQRCGAAMGAKFSPSLANLYMGWWERSRIFWDGNPFRSNIKLYLRYIDDLLLVVVRGTEILDSLLKYLDTNNRNLSFTGQAHPIEMCYLDVCMRTIGSKVETTLYRKPLSGNTLLMARSGHPKHTIKGIPVGQFLRIRRICSNDVQFNMEAARLYKRFQDRNYPNWMLDRALKIAQSANRQAMLNDDVRKKRRSLCKKPKLTLSTPFSLEFSEIKNIINRYLPILCTDDICASILKDGINMVSRRAPTLGQSLSPSFYDRETRSQSLTWLHFKGNFKCGSRDCPCCSHILGGNSFKASTNQKIYAIDSFFNCNTNYVVYLITCIQCNIQYVGRTIRRLRDRFYEHVHSVEKNKKTNIARHFRECHLGDITTMKVQVIEKIRVPKRGGDVFRLLCRREVFWIFQLQTRIPFRPQL